MCSQHQGLKGPHLPISCDPLTTLPTIPSWETEILQERSSCSFRKPGQIPKHKQMLSAMGSLFTAQGLAPAKCNWQPPGHSQLIIGPLAPKPKALRRLCHTESSGQGLGALTEEHPSIPACGLQCGYTLPRTQGGWECHPHCTDEKTEAQKEKETCSSHQEVNPKPKHFLQQLLLRNVLLVSPGAPYKGLFRWEFSSLIPGT